MSIKAVQVMLMTLVGIVACAVLPGATLADLYKYKDASGTLCITDRLDSVPVKFRGSVQVVKDDAPKAGVKREAEQAPAASEEPQPPPVQPQPPAPGNRFEELSAKYVWFKPLAMVGALVVGLLIAGRVARLLPTRQFGRLFSLVVFLGIIVWAYKCYMDQMVANYLSVKEKVVTMFKKANQRGGQQAGKEEELAETLPGGQPEGQPGRQPEGQPGGQPGGADSAAR